MFDDYYGFTGKPFQLTPDPEFFFRSVTHRKALSYLGYGLAQGEGFIVITGEIGAGKSTLVAHMMQSLDAGQVTVAQVVTSKLDGEEIIHVIARSFGLDIEGHDKATALGEIEAFFHSEARAGRRCLLVVDEAQNLTVSALEELRMLSNFQLGNHPLLQVLLLGQPEFRTTLQKDEALEQLRQRVIAAHHLEPMQKLEIEPYVTWRLQKVGWNGNPAFDQRVYSELFDASGGIPRKLNQIVNRLLLLGAVEERTRIDAAMLQAVMAEMAGERAFPEAAPAPMPVAEPEFMPVGAMAPAMPAFDPQVIDDLLAERDVQIAELQQAVVELATQRDQGEPEDTVAPASQDDLAALRAEFDRLQAELEQTRQADLAVRATQQDLDVLREQFARLEARTFEQERTIRQTLSMLIEWIEGEMDSSKAA